MKIFQKFFNITFILLISFTFSNCTAWPAVAALIGLTKKTVGIAPVIVFPPNGNSTETPTKPSEIPIEGQVPVSSNILVSTTTVSGYYPALTIIDIKVKFGEPVVVTGTPRLKLNNLVNVNYTSGTGTDTLSFRYTVQSGNSEDVIGLDAASQTALELNDGTIKSVADNKDMTLILPFPGAVNSMGHGKIIVIDTIAPSITNITSNKTNGTYGTDASISIQIVFSETINVQAATPQLTLETGDSDRIINCNSGSGTDTLTCVYQVQEGDRSSDLDYVSTNSLVLNSSTIKDAAGNNANITLFAPGTTNSLGSNKDIIIDTTLPTISFTSTSSSGLESVASPTFSVTLSTTPTRNITVPYSITGGTATGDGGDYLLAAGTLTWNAGDDTTKTISLTVIEDGIDENNETIIVSLGSPTSASLGINTSHTYTIIDNDPPPTVSFESTGTSASEVSTNVSIPVSLSSVSNFVATIDYSVTGGTAIGNGVDYTLAAGTLTFPAGTTTQNISLVLNNDLIVEGSENLVINLSNAGNALIGSNSNFTFTITDDDIAGVTITPSGASTDITEGGATDSYAIVLNTQPSSNVTITFNTGTQVNPITNITFTTANWNSAQVVLVNAVNDNMVEGAHTQNITHTATSSDSNYNGIAVASIPVNITDNDIAGATITQSGGATNITESGGNDTYTIVLNTQPSSNVTIAFGVGTQVSAITNLTFTNANWNTPQTVTVTAVNDDIAEGAHTQSITHTATSGDANYNGISIANITANISDNDSVGVTITENGGSTSITEGGSSDTYTVVLNTQPTANVTISFAVGTQVSAISNLTFTNANWNTAQTVNVSAINDNVVEGTHTQSITHTTISTDANYNGITIVSVTANITDNDTAGVTITQTGTTDITEGGATDSYTVVLTSQPSSDVTISFGTGTQVSAISNLTFTNANWNTAQTVSVNAINDNVAEGAHTQSITHTATSADTNYNGITIASVTANIADNDTAGVTITQSGTTDITEGGATDSYTVVLTSQPTANVTISFGVGAQVSAISNLTFTNANWNSAQTVTVSAVNDNVVEGPHTQSITHTATSADTNYNGITIVNVTANITDNDTAGVEITQSGTTDVTEGGATDSYTVVLTSQPTANVTISFGVGTQVNAISNLTFTNANWNTAQTVTVSAVNDNMVEGAHTQSITHTVTSTDANYNGITIVNVTANITDNDTAGVTINQSGTTDITEGGATDSYTIVLNSQPTANVTIAFGIGTQVSTISNLTFTNANWNTAQTVTVSAVNDNIVEGAHNQSITHTATSADTNYNGITIASIIANITDNDIPGITIIESAGSTNITEAGGSDSYTIVLNTQPSSDVTISFGVGTQVSAIGNLTFTNANWNTAQTVTVSTINDNIVEGAHTQNITHTAISVDTNYNGISITNVTANITDNDTAGVTITQSGTTDVTEDGATDSYTIVLNSQPTADVTIAFNVGTQVSAITSLTFTNANWNTAQTVTVTAVNDNVVEGAHTQSITHTATSADGNYDGISTTNVTANITDNDTAGVTITQTGTTDVTEGGATDSYTVVLTSQPSSDVTISFGAGAQVNAISNITFTNTNWNTAQTITVSAIDDTVYEGMHSDTITHTVTSGDSNYNGIVIPSITVNIADNESLPTLQFAATTSNSTDESSATRNITVTLSNAASQNITVTVTDTTGVGAGLAISNIDYATLSSPFTLTFSPGTTTQNISIPVIQDLEFEGNETIQLTLSNPSNATLGTITGHTFTLMDDDAGVLSAETMDIDNNGKIDHYRITFSEAVQDSTFPGYIANSLGTAQVNWRVGGSTIGVVFSNGTAEPVLGDIANDEVIYLKFTESGFYDTDSKPEITTNGNPTLITVSSKTIGVIYTATVSEADRAKPVIVSNSGTTSSTNLSVTFSEPVWGAINMPVCGSGGELFAASITYTNTSGNGTSSIVGMGSDSCGTDATAIFTADTAFISPDNATDTIAGNGNLYDAANNIGNTRSIPISVSDPNITNIQLFDTNKNGKIDQLRITFSLNMNDGTIDDFDANLFMIGGSIGTKVDTGSGGTGMISSPNTDPGLINDNIVTLFTDDSSVSGTDLKSVSFTMNPSRWLGSNGVELQTIASLSAVTQDKAPPVILTAVASDNTNLASGVDSDDTLTLTFSEITNKPMIDSSNISSIFGLNNGHVWGTIISATWNPAGDILVLVFAGSGSNVAVGDTITILGTLSDIASTPNISYNIPSLNPISGTFYMVDTSTPTVISATSINATTVRVTYSKAMNVTDSTNPTFYKIVASPGTGTCADNTNYTGGTSNLAISAVTQVDTKTFDLTTAAQSAISYTLLADKSNIKDLQPVNLNCPNNADFTGNENIKASAAVCSSTNEIVFTFSKPVKTGLDVANSAECSNATECAKRYYITPATLGSITSVKILDGINCSSAAANASKVCITHTLVQGGGNYTVIAANNADGDGFDNTGWGALQNSTTPIGDLQTSPKDRVSFTGCGAGIHNFTDGPISTDPFGDNAYFGYVMSYFNKIYVGPNTKGNAASRFNPDGSSPETMSFEFSKDTTGTGVSNNSAVNRDGGIVVPPFVTIGHTGCTLNSANIATGCGPNNENGRGLFASGIISGAEYLFITGARSTGNDDYLYYTSDTDTALNFNYLDASATFNGAGIAGNSGTESIIVLNNKVYWMSPGNRSARPYFVKINNLNQDQIANTDSVFMNMRHMTGFGGNSTIAPNRADKLGGTLFGFNDRIYLANSGSNSTDSATCDAGSTYSASATTNINRSGTLATSGGNRKKITGLSTTSDLVVGMLVTGTGIAANTVITTIDSGTVVSVNNNSTSSGSQSLTFSITIGGCEQTGGIIRSTNNDPAGCSASDTCANWVDITPNSAKFKQYFTIVLLKLSDLIQAERPVPGFESFHSKLYMIRNACTTRLQNRSCNNAAPCEDDVVCPAGNEIPQVWKCDPTNSGVDTTNPTTCESGEWSLVAENGSSGKTNMNVDTNKKVSLLVKNGSQLYVGYDNATLGIQMWRTKSGVTDPTSESDFEQIGGNGLGDTLNNLELYSAVSLEQSGSYYLYVSAGRPGTTPVQPLRVYRQVNNGPLAFLSLEYGSELLAYINQEQTNHYKIGLIALIICILLILIIKRYMQRKRRRKE